jgi:cold shock CspA family protein/ribosome-associated translation inhibitor RaiA
METPFELEIQGFEPSSHLREQIAAQLSKLERRYGRITACRVAIRAPNAHHKMGEPYFVSVHLALPSHRDVTVKPPPRGMDARQGNLTFAVNDAFRRANRQLRDHASRMRGRPAVREQTPRGTIIRLDPSGTFGFLETEDGREIYLHAHSVLDGNFNRLKPGVSVAFHEETGEKGPQASTVRMI